MAHAGTAAGRLGVPEVQLHAGTLQSSGTRSTGYFPTSSTAYEQLQAEGWFEEEPNHATAFDQILSGSDTPAARACCSATSCRFATSSARRLKRSSSTGPTRRRRWTAQPPRPIRCWPTTVQLVGSSRFPHEMPKGHRRLSPRGAPWHALRSPNTLKRQMQTRFPDRCTSLHSAVAQRDRGPDLLRDPERTEPLLELLPRQHAGHQADLRGAGELRPAVSGSRHISTP